ncbi:hypothetical protein [Shewanella woodyi]|uniref:Lantibiotic n=1 Tax=Shewanella woodyi (strain ATCC 51908 / MS32) TaxID=392500 RepID=B1KEQ4_SHEWM|nr:hypothetical protein [Shewanella woodyi]ACA88069.1 hypothetical protein Swoo_3810 [Shewanella woodyi ATCC 51908]
MDKNKIDHQQANDEKFELIEEQLLINVAGGRSASFCSEPCLPGFCYPELDLCISV